MSVLLPVKIRDGGGGGGGVIGLQVIMIHSSVEKLQSSPYKLNSKSVHYIVVIDIAICSQ